MHADTFVSTNIPWLNVIWKSLLRLIIKQPEGTLSVEAQQRIADGFTRRFRDCQIIIDQEYSTFVHSASSSSSIQNRNEDLSASDSHPHGFELVKFFLTLFVTFAKQFQPELLHHALSTYQATIQTLFVLLDHVG